MSESEKDTEQAGQQTSGEQTEGIDDEQLPEDLQPSEENPLAEPLDPKDEATHDPEDLDMRGGKPAEEWDGDEKPDDSDDSDDEA